MKAVNENPVLLHLRVHMERPEGWGREQGRLVFQKLIDYVESRPGTMVFKVSIEGVQRVDISFASETVVELARRYRGGKGFCFVDLDDPDMLENWDAAAQRKSQPLMVWHGTRCRVIGAQPSQGNAAALAFSLQRPSVRVSEFAAATAEMTVPNASNKFKQLWEQGFLLRREETGESGGIEYVYQRIG